MLGSEYTQSLAPALLLAAHPDDEIAGAAGWAWRHPGPLSVAILTRGVPLDRRCFAPGYRDAEIYAAARRGEAEAVWRGHPRPPSLFFAPFADQGLYQELSAAAAWLRNVMAALRPAIILAPAYEAGHPDHDAVNLLAAEAGRGSGAAVFEYALYHLCGDRVVRQRFQAGPVERLPPDLADRKAAALAGYASQAGVLCDFSAAAEAIRPCAGHDYSRPAGHGPALYERWGWAMSAAQVSAALSAHSHSIGLPCGS